MLEFVDDPAEIGQVLRRLRRERLDRHVEGLEENVLDAGELGAARHRGLGGGVGVVPRPVDHRKVVLDGQVQAEGDQVVQSLVVEGGEQAGVHHLARPDGGVENIFVNNDEGVILHHTHAHGSSLKLFNYSL